MINGEIRIVARSQEEAEEIAGYLHRLSGGRVWFRRPERGRARVEWLAEGSVEVPNDQDTRTWHKEVETNEDH